MQQTRSNMLHTLACQTHLCVCLQDLRRARLVVWTEDPAALVTNDTAPFLDAFAEHITVKRFNYNEVWQMSPAAMHL